MNEVVVTILLAVGIPLLVLFFTFRVMKRTGAWQILTGKHKRRRKRLMHHGRQAKARILDLGESSKGWVTTVNGNPVVKLALEVHDGNLSPYQTMVTQLVSRLDVPQLQPGAWINVMVDPNDAQNVILGGKPSQEPQAVGNVNQPEIKYGHEGMVTIKGVRELDYKKDGQPVYSIEYDVQSEKHGNYTITKDVPLPPHALQMLRINATYSAKIDNYERSRVVINVK